MSILSNSIEELPGIILLSDDFALSARIQRLLTKAGFHVTCFQQPEDAISVEKESTESMPLLYLLDATVSDRSWKDVLQQFGHHNLMIDCVLLLSPDDDTSSWFAKRMGVYEIFPKTQQLLPLIPSVITQIAQRLQADRKRLAIEDGLQRNMSGKQDHLNGLGDIFAEISDDHSAAVKNMDRDQIIEQRVKLLEYNTGEMISRHCRERTLLYISPACKDMLGYPQEEMLGTSIYDYIHPDDAENIRRGYQETVDAGKSNFNETCRVKRKDGRYIWMDVVNRILYQKGTGHVSEIVSISRDVTAHREKEELLKAKEIAEQANRAKSEFLANVSHEIRNPLCAIIGMAKTLEKSRLDERQINYLRSITVSANNLLVIFNDMLDYTRLESQKLKIVNSNFSIKEAVEELMRAYGRDASVKNNKLILRMGADVPQYISTDKQKVQQILSNLISNAIKFTVDGEVTISIKAGKREGLQESIIISVKDTGIGVPPQDIPGLFDPLYQLDGSTKKEHQGVGLGLSIAKGLVELLGGRLDFESAPGEGSTAVFSIPLVEEKPRVAADSATGINYDRSGTLQVLVAEDDTINQMYLAGFLRDQGWEVDTANNGQKALERYQNGDYDIILMDGQMPRMDGLEAARKIRELEEGREYKTPIVAITGYAIPGDKERFIDAGMDAYISKPIDENELLKTVRLLTDQKNKKADG